MKYKLNSDIRVTFAILQIWFQQGPISERTLPSQCRIEPYSQYLGLCYLVDPLYFEKKKTFVSMSLFNLHNKNLTIP